MKKIFLFCLIVLSINLSNYTQAQTIEQRLVVVQNDGTVGGNFRVEVQVKGTNLPAANTVGSATIDIQYNNTHLNYVNATLAGGPTIPIGYNRTISNLTTYIRIAITGGNIGPTNELEGYDIGTAYVRWAQLNFTILNDAVTTDVTINNGTNAIGLFENHANNPETGVINNQTLTAPENISNVPLPVELTSFTSKLMNDKIQLNWSTKTEVNNFGFEVERSTDGINFSKIGFVEGNGNSNSEKNYSYTDAPKTASTYSYRLKQIDNDGKYEYSKKVEVDFIVKPTEYSLYQNYPNPFNPSTVIKYQLPKDNFVSLKVYNAIGQEVASLVNEVKPTGVYEVNFNASDLSSGIYYYILRIGTGSSNEYVRTNKMILLK